MCAFASPFFAHVFVCLCVGPFVVICPKVTVHAPGTGVYLSFSSGCFVLPLGLIRPFLSDVQGKSS